MIKSITVTNYLGESIELELDKPDKTGFLITSIEGLGPVKANINMSELSTMDGSKYNSAKAESRNIVLGISFCDTGDISIEDLRQKTYKYFPLKKPLSLTIKTDNRESMVDGYVESNEPTMFKKQTGTQISIVCPDSYLYSKNTDVTVFSGIEPLFEFPFENNSLVENVMEFGEIRNKTENVVTYHGDAEIGVTISIHTLGDVEHITIFNTLTREIMKIDTDKLAKHTGSILVNGDEVTICTVKGHKSATLLREGVVYNIINCLNRDADWFQLGKGDNLFAYAVESGNSNVHFTVSNRISYEGV